MQALLRKVMCAAAVSLVADCFVTFVLLGGMSVMGLKLDKLCGLHLRVGVVEGG